MYPKTQVSKGFCNWNSVMLHAGYHGNGIAFVTMCLINHYGS